MPRMTTTEARKDFSDALNRVAYKGERIEIHRRGKSVAAIVSIEDLKLVRKIENQIDLAKAKKAEKEKGSVSWKKLKRELGL